MTRVPAFIALAFGITWVTMLPAILAFHDVAAVPAPLVMLGALIGSCGPTIAALLVARREGGPRTLLAPNSSTSIARIAAVGALAFATPFLLHMLGASVASLFGAPSSVWTLGTPSTFDQRGIFVVAPLGEELGWRGFLQRRLERSLSPVRASLAVGVAWALWHAPMIVARTPPTPDLVVASALIVAGAVVFAALFRASGTSVAVAMLAHAGVHADNVSRVGGAALYATCGAFFVAAIPCALFLRRSAR